MKDFMYKNKTVINKHQKGH